MILITTPTGNIGKVALSSALQGRSDVRVLARDASRIPDEQRQRIEIVSGSQEDPDALRRAFENVDTVFWCVPPNPQAPTLEAAYVGFSRPAAKAIQDCGVRRVVLVSALGRGTPWESNAGLVTASLAMEDLFASTGVHCRSLTMPSFMDNLLRQLGSLRDSGKFFLPADGDRKAPTCAVRDIGETASRLLLEPTWTGVEDVAVLGPADLSLNEQAQIMTAVLQKPITYERVSYELFEKQLLQQGVSPAFVSGYTAMFRAKDNGLDNGVERTPTNSTPTTFHEWATTTLLPATTALP